MLVWAAHSVAESLLEDGLSESERAGQYVVQLWAG
jgi:hypothetical protein